MTKEFVVITETGNTSFSIRGEEPERFRSFNAAKARAESLAKCAPGESIKIFELVAEAVAPVERVRTSRVNSQEKYAQPRS